ncbi:hypothetical protein LL998_00920 [Burkholderia ambifaria]|uniref:hypothetical protein n=1 Tax=Burkholderia ambifaria TaxID=152480 RepID=UPI001E3F1888|nr:hypothetical protein [Burkholderia ambifaria]UEP34892.1 hypothetical protein LL998_00920 [Burkholderia ambifaria]
MEIIEQKKIAEIRDMLAEAVTLNRYVGTLFTGMADALNTDDFKRLHVSVEASTDGVTHSITVNTPHGTIVGIAEHARSERNLIAKIAFVTVRVNGDGQTTPTEIMTLAITGYGFVTEVDGVPCDKRVGDETDDDLAHDFAWRLLSNLHDKLPGTSDISFFSF